MTESIQVGNATVPAKWHQHSACPERIIISGSCVYTVHDATSADGNPNPDVVRLMAAAPELLKALHKLVDYGEEEARSGVNDDFTYTWEEARQAIAKAEGRGE